MHTTLTRPITSAAAQANAINHQSKSDATEALKRLIDAKALIKGARLMLGDDMGYESKNELIHATQALLATEEIMLSMGRKADSGDMNIDGDAHNVASIVFLTQKVIWGEHALCSDAVVHASTLLDKAYEVISDLAGSVVTKVTH